MSAPGFLALRLWVADGPLRLAPLWCLLAGATLAAGGWPAAVGSIRLLLAALLVEALWGGLWGQMQALPAARAGDPAAALPLPYAAGEAPLGRLWRWLQGETRSVWGRDAWLALAVALIVAAALGRAAVAATLVAAAATLVVAEAATLLVAVRPRRAAPTTMATALLAVALPWALGVQLVVADGDLTWPERTLLPVWLLAACFTLLRLGLDRWQAGRGRGLYVAALLALPALLIWQGEILAAAGVLLILGLAAWRLSPARQHGWQWLALLLTVALWL